MAADLSTLGADGLREIRCLRERIGELEEENRQLKAALRPSVCFPASWKLWPREAKLLAALYASPGCVSYESLRLAMVGIQARARGLDAAPEEPSEEKAPPAGKGKAEGKPAETKPPADGGKPPAAPAA